MSVGKIFKVLIIIVACVLLGAVILNVLLPNTVTAAVDAVEDQIFNATGMTFDLNGNGNSGNANTTYTQNMNQANNNGQNEDESNQVQGFN